MPVKVYMTNITSNQLTIGNQRKLKHILDTNKIDYVDIDISDPKYTDDKEFLQRALASVNKKMNLPQIFYDESYCGDFDDLLAAVEANTLKSMLKLHGNENENVQ
jgi:glutaredoxin